MFRVGKLYSAMRHLKSFVKFLGFFGPERSALEKFFDKDFYLENNPDVRVAGVDPLTHYLKCGWKEGRNPSQQFDTQFYLEQNPHLFQKEICPLVHYVKKGRHKNVATLPKNVNKSEETDSYGRPKLQKVGHDEVAPIAIKQLQHTFEMLGFDSKVLGDIPAWSWSCIGKMFSPELYAHQNNIMGRMTDLELFTRFVVFDLPKTDKIGPLFDAEFYRGEIIKQGLPRQKPGEGLFIHWLRYGIPARVVPNRFFDPEVYLSLNQDIRGYHRWVFKHWVEHGIDENRHFSNCFFPSGEAFVSEVSDQNKGVRTFLEKTITSTSSSQNLECLQAWRNSKEFSDILDEARAIEPEIGDVSDSLIGLLPPFHDSGYSAFRIVRDVLPERSFDYVILMPFCKLGGADYVAGVLAHCLPSSDSKTLIIRTEQSDWERPDWFPDNIESVDISKEMKVVPQPLKHRVFYELIRWLSPQHVFNVNSRLGFETFERFGERMSVFTKLYAYYFCADRTPKGTEAGYPVTFFANVIPHLAGAMIDTHDLADKLTSRYALPSELRKKVHTLYTPSAKIPELKTIAEMQIKTQAQRRKPKVLWAGRFDRQKRFDLLTEIAIQMPKIEFHAWGKAVLDSPPNLHNLPRNLIVHPPFTSLEDLPLNDSDLWLYTSAWDGMPTIIIECAAYGLPIVASAVGGVGEMIDDSTGWPLSDNADVSDYAEVIRDALENPQERLNRAQALQERVRVRHSEQLYKQKIVEIIEGGAN